MHVNSKSTCLLPSKTTSYALSIKSLIFKLPIPGINDYVFAKELIKVLKQHRSYLSFGNTLSRMLAKDDLNSKHMRLTWFEHHENVCLCQEMLQNA